MSSSEVDEALSNVRVLDLTGSVAGQFCGRLFADNGASVLLGEPRSGSPVRANGPFASVPAGATISTLFWHLNLGKQSVEMDLADGTSRQAAAELIREATVVIVDLDTEIDRFAGETLESGVLCRIAPFGPGELSEWKGSELIFQALSGTMYENGRAGMYPLFGLGHRASYGAGVMAYVECVSSLLGGPTGRHVAEVSVAEVAASMNFNRVTEYSYNYGIEGRVTRETPRSILRCADGWIGLFVDQPRWVQTCRGLGVDELVDDPRFSTEPARLRHWSEFEAALEVRLTDRLVDDVVTEGQTEKVRIGPAIPPLKLRNCKHLVARGFWERSEAREDLLPRLGPMFRMSSTPQRDHGGAPIHPDLSLTEALARWRAGSRDHWWKRKPATEAGGAHPGPLAGIRIVDLTTAWAGPMATRILGALGADVVKIEGPGRIDDWRGPAAGGDPSRYPDLDPGAHPYDRNFQFNTQNHNKRGMSLDLKNPAGREVALDLVRRADVMVANFTVGTLERLGLGWEDLRSLNPRLVLLEMPAFGAGGPYADFVGVGPIMEMMSGMASVVGYGDGRPVTTGPAYLDPMGGMNGAAAVVTALAAREATGEGQHIELAQREAAMHWYGEVIVHDIGTGTNTSPRGNRADFAVPHDAFPAVGEDQWVAIAAHTDDEFAAMCRVMQLTDFGARADLQTFDGRLEREDEIFDRVSAWTRTRDKSEMARQLQEAGVHAAAVFTGKDLSESRFLAERHLLVELAHSDAGKHVYQGVPLHLDSVDFTGWCAAPCFGEHTDEVLRDWLGYDQQQVEEIRKTGCIEDVPRGLASTS